MAFYKFNKDDILVNTIKSYPQVNFFINNKYVFYNQQIPETGSTTSTRGVPNGHISLHELNIDRPSGQLISPFVYKTSDLNVFRSVTTSSFNQGQYGDKIDGYYPMSASLSVDRVAGTHKKITALKNTMNFYRRFSQHYEFNSGADRLSRNIADLSTVNLISIPSIFYGSQIKKGTVDLKFLVSGTLLAQLKDEKQNGELIQTGPEGSSGSGSTQGIVLYNEGFLLLTGSASLDSSHTENYLGSPAVPPAWIYFATTGSATAGTGVPSSSFDLAFSGTSYIENITMFAHAKRGELNHSNNPTYILSGSGNNYMTVTTGSGNQYKELDNIQIKNVVSASYQNVTGSFEKTTYISKIGIYDKDKNLIGITSMAVPIKKTANRGLTFKIKYDI